MPSTPHIAAFWRDFAAAEATLQAVPLRERVEQANDLLTPHVQGLALEMQGGPDDEVIELIVTAHGSIENFPLLSQVVAAAPKLAHYRVTRERSARADDGYGRTVAFVEYKLSRRSVTYLEMDHTRWGGNFQGAANKPRATGVGIGMRHSF